MSKESKNATFPRRTGYSWGSRLCLDAVEQAFPLAVGESGLTRWQSRNEPTLKDRSEKLIPDNKTSDYSCVVFSGASQARAWRQSLGVVEARLCPERIRSCREADFKTKFFPYAKGMTRLKCPCRALPSNGPQKHS